MKNLINSVLSLKINRKSKNYYRTVLVLLFLLIGLIIASVSLLITGYNQISNMHKEFETSAANTLAYKHGYMCNKVESFHSYIVAVENSSEFKKYLAMSGDVSHEEKNHILNILKAVSRANHNIMQYRYIDENGLERLRVDRGSIGSEPFIVKDSKLQNKSNRYYFKEAILLKSDEVWFSNIDLNIEHGKIQVPIVPTLRVAKSIYSNGESKGILIINIFMGDIFYEILESELFHVAVVDNRGYLLVNNLHGYKDGKSEWTRYLKESQGVMYAPKLNIRNGFFPNLSTEPKHYKGELCAYINNTESLSIILEEKTEKLAESTKNITLFMGAMALFIFAISVPIALIVARYPIKLHEQLERVQDNMSKQLAVIDKYVNLSTTDLDGNITSVSTSFCKLNGYNKEELIGQNHRMLKDENASQEIYENMWKTILSGKTWSGELKNRRKNGEAYWAIMHITPHFDENNSVTSFTAFRENITDKKKIEELSIRDELTKAYNRRYFNQTFSKELKRSKRSGSILSFLMMDIDYFKKYNDTYGHLEGDNVLKLVVETLSKKLQRAGDYLFRVGGEEFIVIYLDKNTKERSEKFAYELVASIEAKKIKHIGSEISDYVTISAGLINVMPDCDIDEDEIRKRADEALYSAKKDGRNRLSIANC